MNHELAADLLPAYVDKELSLSEAAELELHLNSCAQCQTAYSEQISLSKLIKTNAPYFNATPELQQRLVRALPVEQAQKNNSNFWDFNWLNSWGSKGAVMGSIAALVLSASLFLAAPSAQEKLTQELIASHVRSLQADHLSDVISTDKHTVKPWFNGKLDFAPPVLDLATTDFKIEGGRLDYVDEKTVAVIIYRHNKHPINLYVWPSSEGDDAVKNATENGYNLAHWRFNKMNYWAVSDLESAKLAIFAKALISEASTLNKN